MARTILLALLTLLGAPGCASLSEQDCRGGDWYAIGLRDGAGGRDEAYVAEHEAACGQFGVAVDYDRWLEGRERGLERYCTARNGYTVGVVGGSYSGACFAGAEFEFRRGYELGLQLNRARGELVRLESEIRDVESRLASTDKPPTEQQRQYLLGRLRQLEYDRGYRRRDVDEIEWRSRSL